MIALVFAGQGSESPFMGKDFYDSLEEVRQLYLYAEKVTGLPLREVAFHEEDDRLHETLYAQILLFLFDVFVVDLLKEKGLEYDVTFGLSLGEYGALYASGVVDQETGLMIIKKRAELMSNACDESQGMAAILGLEADDLLPLVNQKDVFLANYNTHKQLVISGNKESVKRVCEDALKSGAKRAVVLSVSGAFHTPYLLDASKQFGEFLEGVELKSPEKKLLLNTMADASTCHLKEEMTKQMVSSVYFYQSVEQAILLGVDTFVEIAPKSVVKSMIKKVNRKVNVFTVSTFDDVEKILSLV